MDFASNQEAVIISYKEKKKLWRISQTSVVEGEDSERDQERGRSLGVLLN